MRQPQSTVKQRALERVRTLNKQMESDDRKEYDKLYTSNLENSDHYPFFQSMWVWRINPEQCHGVAHTNLMLPSKFILSSATRSHLNVRNGDIILLFASGKQSHKNNDNVGVYAIVRAISNTFRCKLSHGDVRCFNDEYMASREKKQYRVRVELMKRLSEHKQICRQTCKTYINNMAPTKVNKDDDVYKSVMAM